MTFRKAEARDAEAIARIYNEAMPAGVYVTPEVAQVDAENRRRWMAEVSEPFGAWVIESTPGEVVGWTSLRPFAVRPTYTRIAEISAYVTLSKRGLIGARLLACAVHVARRRGFRSIVSITSDKNLRSVSGCVAYGFKPTAVLYEVGRLGGNLENALWLQKNLLVDDPAPYRKVRDSILRAECADERAYV
jgi:phosphinothricin acetyltransferase